MSLTADNCKVVYVRLLWPAGQQTNPDILKLAAKFNSEEFSVWVKSTKRMCKNTSLYANGLRVKNGELFLLGQRLKTIDLNTALTRFYQFITSSPEPILLVTHSSGIELQLLSRTIQETTSADMFKRLVLRVVDTVPIFKKKFPSLKGESQLTLEALISYITGRRKKTENIAMLTSYHLDCLKWLVTSNSVSVSELIENSESCENWLLSFLYPLPLFRSVLNMKDLIPQIGHYTVKKLNNANISLATLKELSQQDDPEILRRYIEKRCAEKTGEIISSERILDIFNLLNKCRPHGHGDHSLNTGQEGSVANEPGSSMTLHGEQYNDYSLLRQHEELVDDPDSVMEELEAPYDSDHFRVRQETQRANYSSTGDQENSSDILDLLTEEQGERSDYNNYPWSFVPGELAHSMDFHTEGQETVNDNPFPSQYNEPTMDWNSFVEVQETPGDGTYPFTGEEEERLADAYSMIEESGALYDNDHSLTDIRENEEQPTIINSINDQGKRDRELLQEWHEKFDPFY